MISVGNTRVLCAASLEERVPAWMKGRGLGWVTAEYAMLPRATQERTQREVFQRPPRRPDARDSANHRARAARGDRHGETRRAHDLARLRRHPSRRRDAHRRGDRRLRRARAGVAHALRSGRSRALAADAPWSRRSSVGIVAGQPLLDLAYDEDSQALVDMNVFMTDAGRFVELQGTAEAAPFDRRELETLLGLAEGGIRRLFALQSAALGATLAGSCRLTPRWPSSSRASARSTSPIAR